MNNLPKNTHLSLHNRDSSASIFHKAVEMGINFKLQERTISAPTARTFPELYSILSENLPEKEMELDHLLKLLEEKVLPHCTNFASPYAMAFPDCGNSVAALTGSIVADFVNQNLIRFQPCAPMATVMEVVVLNWLRQLIGFPTVLQITEPYEAGGIVTTGGVGSNTIAAFLARENRFPGTMVKGCASIGTKFVSIVPSGVDHYSARHSMGWLGMGEESAIRIPSKDFKYDLEALETKLKKLEEEGTVVLMLTAYAGDSYSMTCDNFPALREICDRYKVWFHVDGCHGTQLLFSDKFKPLVKGIALADSVTFDPHKVMTVPYTLSVLLVRDQKTLLNIKRPEDIITGEAHSLGQMTPLFGSKPWLSLRLYMLIKNLGRQGLSKVIERRCEMAQLLAKKINGMDDLILVNSEVHINSVIFMYYPMAFRVSPITLDIIQKLNNINGIIQDRLVSSGEVWLHTFQIPDSGNVFGCGRDVILQPLRFMSGNPIITEDHLDIMLDKVRNEGRQVFLKIDNQLG